MKRLTWITLAIAICASLLAFTDKEEASNQMTITVTSDKVTAFDMMQLLNSKDQVMRNSLKTPYQLKLNVVDGKFIFKALDKDSKLTVKFENGTSYLIADWPVTVVIVWNDNLTTFGMN